tara:strand:- start:36 stop:521 length:486 start_codon:yes stop_codon:yes gene_type:complete
VRWPEFKKQTQNHSAVANSHQNDKRKSIAFILVTGCACNSGPIKMGNKIINPNGLYRKCDEGDASCMYKNVNFGEHTISCSDSGQWVFTIHADKTFVIMESLSNQDVCVTHVRKWYVRSDALAGPYYGWSVQENVKMETMSEAAALAYSRQSFVMPILSSK